jgi:hypothetical protein
MVIEYHDGNAYYYHKVRTGNRVSSVHDGSGELAFLAQQLGICLRREKCLARLEERDAVEAIKRGDQLVSVCCEGINAIAREAIEAAGYHRHDREKWRRRRGKHG